MSEADTTPLALTAALIHEAQRVTDAIMVGPEYAKRPWEDQPTRAKDSTLRVVERARSMTFEEFYGFMTMAQRSAGHPVADVADIHNEVVRYARMLHSIAQALVPSTPST